MTSSGRRRPARFRPSVLRPVRHGLLVSLAAVWAGCAGLSPGTAGPSPGAPEGRGGGEGASPERERVLGPEALEGVRRELAGGDPAAAARSADSLYFRALEAGNRAVASESLLLEARALASLGRPTEAMPRLEELLAGYPDAPQVPEAARELARLRLVRARHPEAARALLARPRSLDDGAVRLLEAAAVGMSAPELRALLATFPSVAARARRPLEAALEERGSPAGGASPAPVRLGVLLPTSGRLARVGGWLLEGIRVALGRHARGGARVELVVEDEEGPDGLAAALGRLEEAGVTAVVGPFSTEALVVAARSRSDPGLALLSPTATAPARGAPHAYALWDRESRELDPALALGRWLGRELEGGGVAALYPEGPGGRDAYLRFLRGLVGGEAWLVAGHGYEPEATTLEAPVRAVTAFGPRAVFAMGGGGNSVLQLAPQLSYYGAGPVVVAGGTEWSQPSTIRRLGTSFSQFRVVASFTEEGATGAGADGLGAADAEGGTEGFREAYERLHRRSLGTNPLPPLGHDAALLALLALDAAGTSPPAPPAAVARSLAALEGIAGATGRLTPIPERGIVARKVLVRVLADRSLDPVTGSGMRAWMESARRLEQAGVRQRRREALRAVEEAGVELAPPEGETSGSGEGAEGPGGGGR